MNNHGTKRGAVINAFFGLAIILGVNPVPCKGHSRLVHQAIAQAAVLSSEGYVNFFNAASVDPNAPLSFQPVESEVVIPLPPISWVTNGAFFEDDTPRYANHFYTVTPTRVPGQARGITDVGELLYVELGLIDYAKVTNSFAWGTARGIHLPWRVPSSETNTETWECARTYQMAALTNIVKADRDANMAHSLYTMGHILHLNQDLTSPDHVRNDEHAFKHWIEAFGKGTYLRELNAFPLEQRGWSYWQNRGFSKVQDFWDRGHFVGNASALDADANDSDKLGLAEFSNGNFLGEDALYAEYFSPGDQHYFPFPSLA